MKKLLLLSVLCFFLPVLGSAQFFSPSIIPVVAAPSGSCVDGLPNQQVISTGTQYSCQAGTWAAIGGSGTTVTGTPNQIDVNAGAVSLDTNVIFPGTVVGQYISGVSYSSQYTGTTRAEAINACVADAMARSNGNATYVCDASSETAGPVTQIVMDETITVGNSAGIGVALILPCTGVWAGSMTDGTSPVLKVFGGASVYSKCLSAGPAGTMIIKPTSTSNVGYVVVTESSSNPYLYLGGFMVYNLSEMPAGRQPGAVTANGIGILWQNGADANTLDRVNVFDDLDAIAAEVSGECCAAKWINSSIAANSGGIPLEVISSRAIDFISDSIVHPGIGHPAFICGTGTLVNLTDIYTELNQSGSPDKTTTTYQAAAGCTAMHIHNLTVVAEASGSSAAAVGSTGSSSTTDVIVSGLTMANGSGDYFLPATGVTNAFTNVAQATNAAGFLDYYNSGLTAFNILGANTLSIIQAAQATGTNASAVATITGAAGGAASNSTSVGKNGGSLNMTGGAGSAGGSTSGTGGFGGALTFIAGAGGAASSGSNTGVGGNITLEAGAAGAGAGTPGNAGYVWVEGPTIAGASTKPFLNITGTWNTTGVVDAGIFMNITNTASGVGSLLADFQVGSVSQFSVDKVGNVTNSGNLISDGFNLTPYPAGISSANTIYYVSNQGSDSNAGTSQSLPWATLSHACSTAGANATIELNSTSIFHDICTPVAAGITITWYGETRSCTISKNLVPTCTNLPIIDGADAVTGWTLVASNTYSSAYTPTASKGFVDSLYTQTTPLTLQTSLANVEATAGSIYSNGTLVYVHLLDGSNPTLHTIEVSGSRTYGVQVGANNNLTVDGVEIIREAKSGVMAYNATATGTGLTVQNSVLFNNGDTLGDSTCGLGANACEGSIFVYPAYTQLVTGIVVANNYVGESDFTDSTLSYTQAAIDLASPSGAIIQGNKVASVHGEAIQISDGFGGAGTGNLVENNEVVNSEGNFNNYGLSNTSLLNNNFHDSYGNAEFGGGFQSGDQGNVGAYVAGNIIHNNGSAYANSLYNGIDVNHATGGTAVGNTIYAVANDSMTLEADSSASSGWSLIGNNFDATLNTFTDGTACSSSNRCFSFYIRDTSLSGGLTMRGNTMVGNVATGFLSRYGATSSSDSTHDLTQTAFDAKCLACEIPGSSPTFLNAVLQGSGSGLYKGYAVDTGTADAYAIALSDTTYTGGVAGAFFIVKLVNASNATSTIAINGGSTKPLKIQNNNTTSTISVQANGEYMAFDDGTNIQLNPFSFAGGTQGLADANLAIFNSATITKQMKFSLTNLSASTVLTVNVPAFTATASATVVLGNSETVASSATPTFSVVFLQSYNVLTANVTSFTLASGYDGQPKTLVFCQNATGNFTVAAPANVHGFFTVGATASKCSSQSFNYSSSQASWLATSTGSINE